MPALTAVVAQVHLAEIYPLFDPGSVHDDLSILLVVVSHLP